MSDREILELAAKAAGIDLVWHGNTDPWCFAEIGPGIKWNPLADDGDALRLAVKLQMGLDTALGQSLAIPLGSKDCVEQHADDPLAATRRAIVRAAAEIGKAQSAAHIGRQMK